MDWAKEWNDLWCFKRIILTVGRIEWVSWGQKQKYQVGGYYSRITADKGRDDSSNYASNPQRDLNILTCEF